MKKFRLSVFALILLFCWAFLRVNAEKLYEDNLALLIAGDIEALIKNIEEDKPEKKLEEKNSELYIAALIADGSIDKAERFLSSALTHYPKNPVLKDAFKQIRLYRLEYKNPLITLDKEEKAHLKIIELFPRYLDTLDSLQSNIDTFIENGLRPERMNFEELESELSQLTQGFAGSKDQVVKEKIAECKNLAKLAKKQKHELLDLISEVGNRHAYFPTRLEYLLEFHDNTEDALAEKESLTIIDSKRQELFLNTLDYYELSVCYRVLAIISGVKEDIDSSKKFFDLSFLNARKMRSLWLIEDVVVYKPILKTTSRSTKFGFVLPQWVVAVQNRFEPR
jgi:hypothetical protein